MKKEWLAPTLEVLDIKMTMASGYEGYHDEGYNGDPNAPQVGYHHQWS